VHSSLDRKSVSQSIHIVCWEKHPNHEKKFRGIKFYLVSMSSLGFCIFLKRIKTCLSIHLCEIFSIIQVIVCTLEKNNIWKIQHQKEPGWCCGWLHTSQTISHRYKIIRLYSVKNSQKSQVTMTLKQCLVFFHNLFSLSLFCFVFFIKKVKRLSSKHIMPSAAMLHLTPNIDKTSTCNIESRKTKRKWLYR